MSPALHGPAPSHVPSRLQSTQITLLIFMSFSVVSWELFAGRALCLSRCTRLFPLLSADTAPDVGGFCCLGGALLRLKYTSFLVLNVFLAAPPDLLLRRC